MGELVKVMRLSLFVVFLGAVASASDDGPDVKEVASAIEGGLSWLASNQIADGPDAGSWECPRYGTAVAGFAGLAFLANGHEPGKGPYGAVLERAMNYVKSCMAPDGYFGARDNNMYVHAIASLFLLSYLGLSEDPAREVELAECCRKIVELAVAAQKVRKPPHERGGWRYNPFSRESDLSVTSWMLLVLHAARQCGFEVDPAVTDAALKYVGSGLVESDGKTGFLYRPGVSRDPEPGVTGAAISVKSLLEIDPDPRTREILRFLGEFPPSWGGRQYKGYFFFGTFYMAQGMFQIGDEAWREFAPKIEKVLVENQSGDGSWPFPPDNKPQSRLTGTAYPTALAVLVLSLEKQYLPMYQRQKRLFR